MKSEGVTALAFLWIEMTITLPNPITSTGVFCLSLFGLFGDLFSWFSSFFSWLGGAGLFGCLRLCSFGLSKHQCWLLGTAVNDVFEFFSGTESRNSSSSDLQRSQSSRVAASACFAHTTLESAKAN